jgi:hypothetical protein
MNVFHAAVHSFQCRCTNFPRHFTLETVASRRRESLGEAALLFQPLYTKSQR